MCGVCKPTQEIRGTVTGYVLSGPSCNNKGVAPKYRNISDLSDTEIHFTGVARVDLPAALLWTCKQETVFQWEAPSVVAFQWLSTLLTASLECSDLDSTTYSQIEAVLDPVEVAKLLWQDVLLTDNKVMQLDNGVEAFPSVHAPDLLHTQQLFLFSRCLEKLPHTLVQYGTIL